MEDSEPKRQATLLSEPDQKGNAYCLYIITKEGLIITMQSYPFTTSKGWQLLKSEKELNRRLCYFPVLHVKISGGRET